MKTKLITSSAAVGAAALAGLCFGSGSAQADTGVQPITEALGVRVFIQSHDGGVPGNESSGWCTYHAVPQPGTTPAGLLPPLPAHLPFQLQSGGVASIWFPGIQTGTVWDVNVDCPNGNNATTPATVVY